MVQIPKARAVTRPPAVAGSWYPRDPAQLREAVQTHLDAAERETGALPLAQHEVGFVAPHAGLVYSGPVAAHVYRRLAGSRPDLVVLVGPSHRLGFHGVSVWPRGAFDTPLGPLQVDADAAASLLEGWAPLVHERPDAHEREHSLEMQLPFLAHLLPDTPILPLVMGAQTPETARLLGQALGALIQARRGVLVASSDLSHFHDAATAQRLDAQVLETFDALDPERLLQLLEAFPHHACGGGPIVSVMIAARTLGATAGQVLRYADSGDVSGDKQSVVGYAAGAFVTSRAA